MQGLTDQIVDDVRAVVLSGIDVVDAELNRALKHGAGGILVKSGNGGSTLAMTTLAAGAAQTWENDSANDLVVSANITGASGNTLFESNAVG